MEPKDIEARLFVAASENYGDRYIEHLLEQYKIYISSAEKISERRLKANEFFLALNTALVALLGFVATKASQAEITSLLTIAPLAGATICYLWYEIIQSHKRLNDAKYKVVHAIESRLPMALYDTEWQALGRGNDKRKYWPFTHIELLVPWIFIAIYVVLFSVAIGFMPFGQKAFCPDDYATATQESAALEKWTSDFFSQHPDSTMTDWGQARHQFWVDNHCVAALQRYEEAKAGKADPETMKMIDGVLREAINP